MTARVHFPIPASVTSAPSVICAETETENAMATVTKMMMMMITRWGNC
jgi:hypothetical protein